MTWLIQNWQSIAAAAIVFLTVLVFAVRLLRRPRAASPCGAACSCAARAGRGKAQPGAASPGGR